jgi:hypothetical protein
MSAPVKTYCKHCGIEIRLIEQKWHHRWLTSNTWYPNCYAGQKNPIAEPPVTAPSKTYCKEREMKVYDFNDCPCVKRLKYKTIAEEMIKGRFQKEIKLALFLIFISFNSIAQVKPWNWSSQHKRTADTVKYDSVYYVETKANICICDCCHRKYSTELSACFCPGSWVFGYLKVYKRKDE